MSRVSDRQLIALLERRNSGPTDPRHVSEEMLQAFLDGRLVHRDAVAAAAGEGRIMDISSLVEAMIQHGIHKVTDGGKGMGAAKYRKLWPKTVTQPPAYTGRFDRVLLVDKTVELATLVKCGNTVVYMDPASCEDMVPRPTKEDGTPLTRYIVFFQDGTRNKGRTVEECRISFTSDEVGLVTVEGLHLPIQHEPILRDHGMDISGSRDGGWRAPCVLWFVRDQPGFYASGIRHRYPRYGSASRGSAVIPVT